LVTDPQDGLGEPPEVLKDRTLVFSLDGRVVCSGEWEMTEKNGSLGGAWSCPLVGIYVLSGTFKGSVTEDGQISGTFLDTDTTTARPPMPISLNARLYAGDLHTGFMAGTVSYVDHWMHPVTLGFSSTEE
jgi:hypothetical protein